VVRRSVVISPDDWRFAAKMRELWPYRELFFFLVWRDIKVRYAQSVLGIGWALIQPIVPLVIFTIVFGSVAKISSDGAPYALFAYAGLLPWTYFANSVGDASGSLVKEVNMLSKIYFPRLFLPLTSVLGRLIDLFVACGFLLVLMAWYGVAPPASSLLLPFFVLLTMLAASGLGLWLGALAVQYRDVRHAVPFVLQFLMYAAPVVYPTSLIPERYRYLYALNPMVGIIEGSRACLLGLTPIPWDLVGIATVSAVALAWAGTLYFIRQEPIFADVA
jgi:lipopolysaccharide transport system permease protein